MEYTITKNEQFNSVEVVFNGKPSEAVRAALKGLRFRWHGVKKLWYGYATEEAVKAAIDGNPKAAPITAPTVNQYGVKVGDIFEMSWGYEQTNVDFFQVVAICGASSVRVRPVGPEMVQEEANSPMSAHRTYKTNTNGELLPFLSRSVFINDCEHGDIKRLHKSSDENGTPYIKFDHHYARKCTGETTTVYESWYY